MRILPLVCAAGAAFGVGVAATYLLTSIFQPSAQASLGTAASSSKGLTEEEAVALLVFGLEDGRTLFGLDILPLKQESSSPAAFIASASGYNAIISIEKTENCKYKTIFKADEGLGISGDFLNKVTFDFNNYKLYITKNGEKTNINGENFICIENNCAGKESEESTVNADYESILKTYEYFEKNFCKSMNS